MLRTAITAKFIEFGGLAELLRLSVAVNFRVLFYR
jgi:hypothetical protein